MARSRRLVLRGHDRPAIGGKVGERIVAAHVAYQKETRDHRRVRAGAARPGRRIDALESRLLRAGRVSAAGGGRKFKGYYRFEHIDIAPGDVVFAAVQPLDGSTVGLRYDIALFAAIKGEYRSWTRGSGSVARSGRVLSTGVHVLRTWLMRRCFCDGHEPLAIIWIGALLLTAGRPARRRADGGAGQDLAVVVHTGRAGGQFDLRGVAPAPARRPRVLGLGLRVTLLIPRADRPRTRRRRP
jgi:hypothetical protein